MKTITRHRTILRTRTGRLDQRGRGVAEPVINPGVAGIGALLSKSYLHFTDVMIALQA